MADTSFYQLPSAGSGSGLSGSMIGAVDPVRIQALLASAMEAIAARNGEDDIGAFESLPPVSKSSSSDNIAISSLSTGLYDSLVDFVHGGGVLPTFMTSSPNSVMLFVVGGPDSSSYEFDETDLLKFFTDKFGPVSSVNLAPDMSNAVVSFITSVQAESVVAKLNGRQIRSGCVLRAVPYQWGSPSQNTIAIIRKYTCRFDIQIDNDKEFHVARRIIGQKGANMKKIVKQSGYDAKLRLRGKGSGFLEGALKQESQEPLHLCVSCKDYNGYKAAVDQINELLTEVYTEYRQYCRMRNQIYPEDLRIVMHEHPLMFHQPLSSVPSNSSSNLSQVVSPPMTPSEAPAEAYDEIERLIEQRNEARRVCNFSEADRIRDLLRTRGIGLMDEPGGRGRGTEVTTWRYWHA